MARVFRLTAEQREACCCDDHLALVSCPGSGKTQTIVERLARCLPLVRDTTRMVGCITYMKSAVNEIEHRLAARLGRDDARTYYDVGTIHSFCLNNIFRPHHWRLAPFCAGFEVLSPDDDRYTQAVRQIIESFRLNRQSADNFELLMRGLTPPYNITDEAAAAYWAHLDAHRFVDFNGIIHYAAALVHAHPFIARGLAARYARLLVDEFQDTSAHQAKILGAIVAHRHTKVFIVGDPHQSIMGFAGGRPDLLEQFADEIGARRDLSLTGNFRCSSKVVALAEALLPRSPAMRSTGADTDCDIEPQWIETTDVLAGLEDHFLADTGAHSAFGQAAILAPNYFCFLQIAPRLRDMGIPIVGPGARPYKRASHLIAPLAEEICGYLDRPENTSLNIIRWRVFDLLANCCTTPHPKLFDFDGSVAIARIIKLAESLREESEAAVEFLRGLAVGVGDALAEHGLLPNTAAEIVGESGASIVADIESHANVDVANLSVGDLGLFSSAGDSMKLLTLHKAKGREFDAVAIIFAQDGLLPFGNPAPGSGHENEARRLFYVGITRAKRILRIFSTASHRRYPRPSRFLTEIFPDGPAPHTP